MLLYGEKIIDMDMLENTFSTFHISRICSCSSNIERKVLQNIMNSSHVFLLPNKIMSCWWEITNPNQLEQHYSLKRNVIKFNHGWGRGGGHDWGRDRGRGRNNYYFRIGRSYNPNFKKITYNDDRKETLQEIELFPTSKKTLA